MRLWLLILFLSLLAAGCTAPKQFRWGNYEDSLYDFYEDPSNASEFKQSLRGIINATSSEHKIAPGIFAEYGYLLYREGQYDQALSFFQKEKAAWPESAPFMDKFISTIDAKRVATSTNNTN